VGWKNANVGLGRYFCHPTVPYLILVQRFRSVFVSRHSHIDFELCSSFSAYCGVALSSSQHSERLLWQPIVGAPPRSAQLRITRPFAHHDHVRFSNISVLNPLQSLAAFLSRHRLRRRTIDIDVRCLTQQRSRNLANDGSGLLAMVASSQRSNVPRRIQYVPGVLLAVSTVDTHPPVELGSLITAAACSWPAARHLAPAHPLAALWCRSRWADRSRLGSALSYLFINFNGVPLGRETS